MSEQWERFVSRGMETIGDFAPTNGARRRYRTSTAERHDPTVLKRVVETQLLPRISMAHARAKPHRGVRSAFSQRQIVEFAELSLGSDEAAVDACVRRHLAKGCGLELVYLDLVQPAARYLGERWSDDTATFAAVTLGLCQMHRLVREFASVFHAEDPGRSKGHHALVSPAANEQHSFGAVMLAEFLRRDGWLVSTGPFREDYGLEAAVRRQRFALVGLSLSRDAGLEALAAQIRRVRQLSLNRTVLVLVGGRVFNDRPEMVARVGADATACDAGQAIAISRNLIAMPADFPA